MKRVAVAALVALAATGCVAGPGTPTLKHVVVNDTINGGQITLTCIRWG